MIERIFFDSMPAAHVEMVSIQPVGNVRLLKKFLKRVAQEGSSVELTFHSTYENVVPLVLQNGLRTTHCQVGLFGSGAYVGSHAGLAHKYSRPNKHGWRRMFAVLVNPGKEVIQGNRDLKKSEVTSTDQIWSPQQYCFFDADRIFVSHLITYQVLGVDERGGDFSRALMNAIERAGERELKSGRR